MSNCTTPTVDDLLNLRDRLEYRIADLEEALHLVIPWLSIAIQRNAYAQHPHGGKGALVALHAAERALEVTE